MEQEDLGLGTDVNSWIEKQLQLRKENQVTPEILEEKINQLLEEKRKNGELPVNK